MTEAAGRRTRIGPIGVGEAWAVLTALSYGATNLMLRAAAVHIDPWLGSMLRQVPVALLAWGFIVVTRSGELRPASRRFLGWPFLLALVASGLVSYVLGNLLFFDALATGSLGVAASGAQAGVVLAAVALGLVILRERPTPLGSAGAGILVVGLGCIGLAGTGNVTPDWILGLILSLGAGASYATANVLIRLVQRTRPTTFVALGAASLGGLGPLLAIEAIRGGGNPLAGADPGQVWVVLAAGCFNALALIGIVQSLRTTNVGVSSSIQSGTVVVSFVGAVLLFSEAAPPLMIVGVAAVTGGIVLAQLRRPTRAPQPVGS
jgi:drug/metabolite transporter (DMT)-like permease